MATWQCDLMTYLSQWEKDLLSTLLGGYHTGDFNCGANSEEMKKVGCPKDDEHIINPPCDGCKFRKRFLNLERKLR
jgi:hypothetical protein